MFVQVVGGDQTDFPVSFVSSGSVFGDPAVSIVRPFEVSSHATHVMETFEVVESRHLDDLMETATPFALTRAPVRELPDPPVTRTM